MAELWYQDALVAIIINLPQGLHLTLCPRCDGVPWEWSYADFLCMLGATKARLLPFFTD